MIGGSKRLGVDERVGRWRLLTLEGVPDEMLSASSEIVPVGAIEFSSALRMP